VAVVALRAELQARRLVPRRVAAHKAAPVDEGPVGLRPQLQVAEVEVRQPQRQDRRLRGTTP
jgi:hypothetical protein